MSAPDFGCKRGKNSKSKLLLCHRIIDGGVIGIEIVIHTILGRVPIKRGMKILKYIAKHRIIGAQLVSGIFVHRGESIFTATARQPKEHHPPSHKKIKTPASHTGFKYKSEKLNG